MFGKEVWWIGNLLLDVHELNGDHDFYRNIELNKNQD